MRPSKQICEVFSPFVIRRQSIIPIITITPPSDRAIRPDPPIIKRWTAFPDSTSCTTLHVPNQGVTRGARLALARKGYATGSFRLNCAESLYVLDENGLCLYQRVDLEDELDTSKHGLMEKPPTPTPTPEVASDLAAPKLYNRRSQTTRKLIQGITRSRKDVRSLFSDSRMKTFGLFNSMESDSGSLGGLACTRTFSEGLCNFVEADCDSQKSDDSVPSASPSLRNLFGALETGKKWFDSLKKEKSMHSQDEVDSLARLSQSGNVDCHDTEHNTGSFPADS